MLKPMLTKSTENNNGKDVVDNEIILGFHSEKSVIGLRTQFVGTLSK